MIKQVATLQSKEQAWDKARPYPVDPNFRWVCMDTRVMRPCEMQTSHLFNSIKMIWNNTCLPEHRIQPYTEYKGVRQWHKSLARQAIINLFGELMNRSDRTKGMEDAINQMAKHFQKVKHYLRER
jgi:hypothetical protein